MQLPLPPTYFAPPPLSTAESNEFISQAHACAEDVIAKSRVAGGPLVWTHQHDQHAANNSSRTHPADDPRGVLRVFEGHDPASPWIKYCLATIQVEATLEEAAGLFHTDTQEEIEAYVHRFGKGLLDAVQLYTVQLYTVVPRTEDAPMTKVGIHWTALQSPGVGKLHLARPRDVCLLECQQVFDGDTMSDTVLSHSRDDDATISCLDEPAHVHRRRRRMWVRALRSVDVACCPDMQASLGTVRMILHGTGHVFAESSTRPGLLDVRYLIQAESVSPPTRRRRLDLRDWILDMGLRSRCRSLLDLDQFLRENRLSRGIFLPPTLLLPKDCRRHCFLCKRRLWPWVHKVNCVKCGEVLCGCCCGLWNVHIDRKPVQIRACSACAQATCRLARRVIGPRAHASMDGGGPAARRVPYDPCMVPTIQSAPSRHHKTAYGFDSAIDEDDGGATCLSSDGDLLVLASEPRRNRRHPAIEFSIMSRWG